MADREDHAGERAGLALRLLDVRLRGHRADRDGQRGQRAAAQRRRQAGVRGSRRSSCSACGSRSSSCRAPSQARPAASASCSACATRSRSPSCAWRCRARTARSGRPAPVGRGSRMAQVGQADPADPGGHDRRRHHRHPAQHHRRAHARPPPRPRPDLIWLGPALIQQRCAPAAVHPGRGTATMECCCCRHDNATPLLSSGHRTGNSSRKATLSSAITMGSRGKARAAPDPENRYP